MVCEGEREVMGLMLKMNAEMVADVLRKTDGSQARSVMAAIAATRTLGMIVDDTLHALVREARGEGRTWAEIGEVLHVTRQAAFQRFGSEPEPDGREESAKPVAEAGPKAIEVLQLCLSERWDELRTTFDARMDEALPTEVLEAAVANVHSLAGAFVAMGVPGCEVVGDYTVVEVLMAFEKGEMKGQVAFNADGQVAGLFLLPVDAGPPSAIGKEPAKVARSEGRES